MNQAKKAALFNALLFPGWGHFYLKKYIRGLFFTLPVLTGTLALLWTMVQVSIDVVRSAPFKKGAVKLSSVLQVIAQTVNELDFRYVFSILLLILILWILSIVDAYLQGRKS